MPVVFCEIKFYRWYIPTFKIYVTGMFWRGTCWNSKVFFLSLKFCHLYEWSCMEKDVGISFKWISLMGVFQILIFAGIYPETAPTLGFCRGEAVYPRECVHAVIGDFLFAMFLVSHIRLYICTCKNTIAIELWTVSCYTCPVREKRM